MTTIRKTMLQLSTRSFEKNISDDDEVWQNYKISNLSDLSNSCLNIWLKFSEIILVLYGNSSDMTNDKSRDIHS